MVAESQLSLADKRQIVYSSLLKFSPEATSLRERALDRLVLGGLVGSTESDGFQLHHVLANIQVTRSGPQLREDIIRASLERLIVADKVSRIEKKKRRFYFLIEKGTKETNEAVSSADKLFSEALSEVLDNTAHYFTYAVGFSIARKVILTIFARFGRDLAKAVTSGGYEASFDRAQVVRAIHQAIDKGSLTDEAIGSLSTRLLEFLKSRNASAEKLKFHLTQGYYFAELLAADTMAFNPLAEQSFKGAMFYLDANVLFIAIADVTTGSTAFAEATQLAKKIGITMAVTRATLNEVRNAAILHVKDIKAFDGKLPDKVTERTDDQFLRGFLSRRVKEPSLTPDQYLEPFLIADSLLRERWGIQLDDRTEDEIIAGRSELEIASFINAESERSKRWKKSPNILRHDVCHLLLVQDARKTNPKTWFLTRDSILHRASVCLAGREQCTCFSLLGFLQSISPFLTTDGAGERSVEDLFSEILSLLVIPEGALFQASELALIAEMHEDVLATPADQLVLALDYVKSTELHGEPYLKKDFPKVALGLKKFLSSTKDQQLMALRKQHAQMEAELRESTKKELKARDLAEQREATRCSRLPWARTPGLGCWQPTPRSGSARRGSSRIVPTRQRCIAGRLPRSPAFPGTGQTPPLEVFQDVGLHKRMWRSRVECQIFDVARATVAAFFFDPPSDPAA